MPDHVHLLLEGLKPACDLVRFVKILKQKSGFDYARTQGHAFGSNSFMIISSGLTTRLMASLGIFGSIPCEPVFALRRRIIRFPVRLLSIFASELPLASFGRLRGNRPPEGGRYMVAALHLRRSEKAQLLVLWQNRDLQD
jgi:hypothetical protein